jgi:hypothetical protein
MRKLVWADTAVGLLDGEISPVTLFSILLSKETVLKPTWKFHPGWSCQ